MVHHQKGSAPAHDEGKVQHHPHDVGIRLTWIIHSIAQHLFLHHAVTKDLSEIGSALSGLIGEVQEDIKHNKDVWNRVFAR